jgi:phthiocerol/phenolphthiocerol synthesis type-I polyketide synthase B
VDGSLLLDELSRAFDLELFVLFSSAAGLLGARGQGHYAGASAFVDALAASRQAEGLPALSVDWGLWGTEGATHVSYFQRVGLSPMVPETALDAMARLMSTQASGRHFQPLVASMDGDRLRAALELRGRGAFLSNLAPASAPREARETSAFVAQLRGAQVALRKGMLADAIAAQVRTVMELAPDDGLDQSRGFFDLGMDSLMTVALKARLEELFGVSLPSTIAMDYPSVAALTDYSMTLLADAPTAGQPANARPAATAPMQAAPLPAATRATEELGDDEVGDALAAELQALELELQE